MFAGWMFHDSHWLTHHFGWNGWNPHKKWWWNKLVWFILVTELFSSHLIHIDKIVVFFFWQLLGVFPFSCSPLGSYKWDEITPVTGWLYSRIQFITAGKSTVRPWKSPIFSGNSSEPTAGCWPLTLPVRYANEERLCVPCDPALGCKACNRQGTVSWPRTIERDREVAEVFWARARASPPISGGLWYFQ